MTTTSDYVPENEDMSELLAARRGEMTDWHERHQAWIAESVQRNRMLAHLSRAGQATLGELATIGNRTVESVSADMGGLHDFGVVTRYGTGPDSLVRWDAGHVHAA